MRDIGMDEDALGVDVENQRSAARAWVEMWQPAAPAFTIESSLKASPTESCPARIHVAAWHTAMLSRLQ